MIRAFLALVFIAAGTAVVVWLGGGLAGQGAKRDAPRLEDEAPVVRDETSEVIRPEMLSGLGVEELRGFEWPAKPEPIRYTDPGTGESVVIPDFLRWYIQSQSGRPAPSGVPGRQAVEGQDVELLTWREPKSMEEAKALLRGDTAIRERMIKWRITAPRARADGLGIGALGADSKDKDVVVEFLDGFTIHDQEQHIIVEGEAAQLQPHLDRARSLGHIVIRHEAFELTGTGLELQRQDGVTRVEIERDVTVRLYGDLEGPDGQAILDLGDEGFLPGHLAAEGRAILVHTVATEGGGEHLTIELEERVHAEQTGGRSLDAEKLLLSTRKAPQQRGGEQSGWRLESFEADGGVSIEFPGQSERGTPYLLSARARRLVHEVAEDGRASTLLEGHPEFTLNGDLPLEGIPHDEAPGFLRASATEQAWFGPADPEDVPPGADALIYRRLLLRGDARLQSRETGLDPEEDSLQGDQLSLLLKETEPARSPGAPPRRVIAVSFAMLGDVRLGGTRMSGMTHRLLGRDLDTAEPLLIAEGPGTTFAFHGLQEGQGVVGSSDASREQAPSSTSASAEDEPVWVVERLRAGGGVMVTTKSGGASVGLPTRLEGEELGYDRISDRARLRGSGARRARASIGPEDGIRQTIEARSLSFERNRAEITAEGSIHAVLHVASFDSPQDAAAALSLPPRLLSTPATLGIATNGRIEIRTRVGDQPWEPSVGTTQVLRIEGDLVAQLTSNALAVDSLRAAWLEVGLTLQPAPDRATTSAPSARWAPPRGEVSTPGRARGATPAPERTVRWDVTSERIRALFGQDGLQSLEATGGVTFESEEGSIAGREFIYDGRTRVSTIRGTPQKRALASFGPPEERNEIRAQELTVALSDEGPTHLHADGGVVATLIRLDPATPGAIERFVVLCRGKVEMNADGLATTDLTEIRRYLRPGRGEAWSSPFRLWADRVTVLGSQLLSREAADVRTLIATGRPTHLRMGGESDETRIWGDRFELDIRTSRATLTGSAAERLRIERGPESDPEAVSEQDSVIIDLDDATIHDWKSPRVILRGAR